ncbi:hypothetical protein M3Y97_00326200 [Aphelenchoides bicaudatus]|nr:hypothetical protein M3Y97_00326200 [Aphelenchoides bicaudatus]
MIANLTLGQRVISLWMLTLAVLIAFVIYLDGGFNSEPMIFFSFLWIADIVLLVVIILRCLRTYNVFGLANETTIGADLPILGIKPGLYGSAVIVSKFIFEVILYIQLRYRAIGIIWMMIPLWVFLGLVSAHLLKGIIAYHKKF